jgi:DNA-binding XRE family transcriptional regulator
MDPEPNQVPKASEATSASASTSGGASSGGTSAGGEPAPAERPAEAKRGPDTRTRPKAGTHPNNVRKLRQRAMMSKAELARRAGVSPLTIDRVESGCPCRMDTKRKILEALGLQPSKAEEVFPDVAGD